MKFIHQWLFPGVWAGFWIYWWIASRRVEKTKRAQSGLGWLCHLTSLCFTFALMAFPAFHAGLLGQRLLPRTETTFVTGAALLLTGLGFAVWARVHLGRYWSGTITLKTGHRLIRSGPYSLVRHPIYTGILAGVFGTAVALGEVRSGLAFAMMAILHCFKRRREDHAAFASALLGYAKRSGPDDFASLTGFLDTHPRSPWRAALLTDLGLEYYNTAHYSLALEAWEKAWPLAKDAGMEEPRPSPTARWVNWLTCTHAWGG